MSIISKWHADNQYCLSLKFNKTFCRNFLRGCSKSDVKVEVFMMLSFSLHQHGMHINILNSFINFIQEILCLQLQEILQYAMLNDIVFKLIFLLLVIALRKLNCFPKSHFHPSNLLIAGLILTFFKVTIYILTFVGNSLFFFPDGEVLQGELEGHRDMKGALGKLRGF